MIDLNTSPYRDKNNQTIHANQLCRCWIADDNDELNGGSFIYERVLYINGEWYLVDLDFDYSDSTERPVLLKDYHSTIEIIEKNSKLR